MMLQRAKGMAMWLCVGGLAAPAIGQTLEIGSMAPKLEVTHWVKGTPVDLAAAKGKQITVIEFWATWCGPCIASIPHLTELQHEYADKNVRIVGVTRLDNKGNTLEAVEQLVSRQGDRMDYTVAFDKEGTTFDAFMNAAGQGGIPTAFVVEPSGRIGWIGHPQAGLDDVLAEMVAGKYDIGIAKKFANVEARRMEALYAGDMKKMIALADESIALRPNALDPRVGKFEALADYLGKPGAAKECAAKALKQWRDRPDRVAEFARYALISDDDEHDFNKLALKALKAAGKKAPKNIDVRVATFRALSAMGKDSKALAAASVAVDLMRGDVSRLRRFARDLSSPVRGRLCGDLALKAVQMAIEIEPDEARHLLSKFRILNKCKKDVKSATITGRYLIEKAAGDANLLNGFAWNLLTEEGSKGKFNDLALAAAEAMYKSPGGDHWMMVDTLALAKFETGAVKEAIELQERAVEQCDSDYMMAELKGRLAKFEEAIK